MIAKLLAKLLVVLTVLPFTAPFATCDGATWLGVHPRSTHAITTDGHSDAALARALPRQASPGQLRLVPAGERLSAKGGSDDRTSWLAQSAAWLTTVPPASCWMVVLRI